MVDVIYINKKALNPMCGPIYFFHAHFLRLRAVGTGGQGGRSPPDFGWSVKPIPTEGREGNRLCPPHHYLPPRIFILCYCPEVSSCFVMSTCNNHPSSTSFSLNQKMGFENSNWWKKNQLSWKVFASLTTALHVSQIMSVCSKSLHFFSMWLTTV